MDWDDILRHIEAGEDAQTEFKLSLSDFSAIAKTLCAFANGAGGLLVLGVDNASGISGVLGNPEKVRERLTSLLHTGFGQPITADCGRHKSNNGWVHWIYVPRHQRGYVPFNRNGRYWIRRGRTTVAPSPSELQELFNAFGFVLTENQVISTATAGDIDLDALRSFMLAQGKNMEEEPRLELNNDLRNAAVCDLLNKTLRPTLYGLMVFGRDPQGHPNTTSMFIQCASYAGVDRSGDVLSSGEGKGRLDEQVTRAMGWFRSLGRKELYEGIHHIDIPIVPEHVLREALVNAVIHRDYAVMGTQVLLNIFDNRVEVISPGTLPNHMTVDQARSGGAPRSRNEMMANAMVVRRLMERRGRGWLLMRDAMRKFNNTEPELENNIDGRFVRVTFQIDSEVC